MPMTIVKIKLIDVVTGAMSEKGAIDNALNEKNIEIIMSAIERIILGSIRKLIKLLSPTTLFVISFDFIIAAPATLKMA